MKCEKCGTTMEIKDGVMTCTNTEGGHTMAAPEDMTSHDSVEM